MKRALMLALTTTLLLNKSAKSPVYSPDNLYAKTAIVVELNQEAMALEVDGKMYFIE